MALDATVRASNIYTQIALIFSAFGGEIKDKVSIWTG